MTVLIDTDIIIDVLTSREPWNEDSEKILLLGAKHTIDVYITAASAMDICSFVRNNTLDTHDAEQIIGTLYYIIGVIELTGLDCVDSIVSPVADYKNAITENIALREGINYIVTNNTEGYRNSTIKIISPENFLKLL